jgi:hypothetical protein
LLEKVTLNNRAHTVWGSRIQRKNKSYDLVEKGDPRLCRGGGRWKYKYHVVFIPKCREKSDFRQNPDRIGEIFRRLVEQKESCTVLVLDLVGVFDKLEKALAGTTKQAPSAYSGIGHSGPLSSRSRTKFILYSKKRTSIALYS